VDGQRFRPHLTVARTRFPHDATSWVRLLDAYAGPPFEVTEVELVESHLGEGPRGRPRHVTAATFPLRER
jgi:RNA 2',3'-cyclic 3'-phosphodiesterase